MHESFLRTLQSHRPTLRERWETLLRAERASSPLANPDSLIYLMDWTLDRLFEELRRPVLHRRGSSLNTPSRNRDCECGMNPLLAYFATAEQAMIETLFIADENSFGLSPLERTAGLEELKRAFHEVAKHEIEAFCSVCQHQAKSRDHTQATAHRP